MDFEGKVVSGECKKKLSGENIEITKP